MKIYAISDTHFGHEKLVQWGRPQEFGSKILQNIRRLHGDMLIHCGDFCIGEDERYADLYATMAMGFSNRILVRGNHDMKSDAWYMKHGFDFVCAAFEAEYFGKRFLFTHKPAERREGIDRNIHGHLHGNAHRIEDMDGYDPSWHFDLAPEIREYAPVNIETIV